MKVYLLFVLTVEGCSKVLDVYRDLTQAERARDHMVIFQGILPDRFIILEKKLVNKSVSYD